MGSKEHAESLGWKSPGQENYNPGDFKVVASEAFPLLTSRGDHCCSPRHLHKGALLCATDLVVIGMASRAELASFNSPSATAASSSSFDFAVSLILAVW